MLRKKVRNSRSFQSRSVRYSIYAIIIDNIAVPFSTEHYVKTLLKRLWNSILGAAGAEKGETTIIKIIYGSTRTE